MSKRQLCLPWMSTFKGSSILNRQVRVGASGIGRNRSLKYIQSLFLLLISTGLHAQTPVVIDSRRAI